MPVTLIKGVAFATLQPNSSAMRLLTVQFVPPARRKAVPIWYAAVKLSLSGEAMRRTRLDFERAKDDLDEVTFAYIEIENVPVMLLRHKGEPAYEFTLMLDAPRTVENGMGALGFVSGALESLNLHLDEVIWRNDALNQMFPRTLIHSKASRLEALDLSQFESAASVKERPEVSSPTRRMRIRDRQQ